MAYDYQAERPGLFTEDGVSTLTKVRDVTRELLKRAGACRVQEVMMHPEVPGGDAWLMLACFDYMVERGEIREVTKGQDVAGQHRIYVATNG